MAPISSADIEQIPIDSIVVGKRRRQKLGNIQSLAKSIERRGLLHPIIVRNGNELVSGQRRLEACRKLGWKSIGARRAETMSDEELRAVENDENVQRLQFSDFESSKARLAQIRQAEAELKAKAAEELSIQPVSKNRKRGRPRGTKKAGSTRAVAEATGISMPEQQRIKDQVSLQERYPFMQQNGWVQHQVLEAGAELEKLPEQERGKIAAMLDQPAIPPKKSIEIIHNMTEKTATERKSIYDLASSNNEHDREVALTEAANLPPPPDPALNRVREARDALKKASEVCVSPEFSERVCTVRDSVIELEKDFTAFNRRKNGRQSS